MSSALDGALLDTIGQRLSLLAKTDQRFRDRLAAHLRWCRIEAWNVAKCQLDAEAMGLLAVYRLEEAVQGDRELRGVFLRNTVDIGHYLRKARKDVRQLRSRIIGREDRLYEDYYQHVAEGRSRLSLVLPLGVLCLALAWQNGVWWSAGVLLPAMLAYLGAQSFADAESALVEAVESGRLELGCLAGLDADTVTLLPPAAIADKTTKVDEPKYAGENFFR